MTNYLSISTRKFEHETLHSTFPLQVDFLDSPILFPFPVPILVPVLLGQLFDDDFLDVVGVQLVLLVFLRLHFLIEVRFPGLVLSEGKLEEVFLVLGSITLNSGQRLGLFIEDDFAVFESLQNGNDLRLTGTHF